VSNYTIITDKLYKTDHLQQTMLIFPHIMLIWNIQKTSLIKNISTKWYLKMVSTKWYLKKIC